MFLNTLPRTIRVWFSVFIQGKENFWWVDPNPRKPCLFICSTIYPLYYTDINYLTSAFRWYWISGVPKNVFWGLKFSRTPLTSYKPPWGTSVNILFNRKEFRPPCLKNLTCTKQNYLWTTENAAQVITYKIIFCNKFPAADNLSTRP